LRPLLVLCVLSLAGCSAPPGGSDGCVPITCEALGFTCGIIDDGCRGNLDCGVCGDGGLDPDAGILPDGGTCTAESHASFCSRYARVCGTFDGVDNCGNLRTGDCGACNFPDRCSDAGTCGCTPSSCADVGRPCGEAYVGCGQYRDCGPCDGGSSPPPHPLRITSANLTSGNLQSYDPGEGTRILQGLRPDVVLLQEFHYGNKTDADARKWVDLAFGEFYFYREPRALPNGVISRYPIVASGTWTDSSVSNRGFAWARIDVPGTRDLWAVSLHFLTSNASARNTEAQELVAFINANVPAGDYLALGGDLNTGSRTEACINTLAGVVYTVGPFPADQANNTNTNASRATPLDWVLADNDLRARQVPLQLGANAFTNGLVFDTRVYTPLVDAAPALSTDSTATGMQHMAVSKQFSLP
jgi:endonuclease/exonuclease/phosphatase family metal-dependent hydrolase